MRNLRYLSFFHFLLLRNKIEMSLPIQSTLKIFRKTIEDTVNDINYFEYDKSPILNINFKERNFVFSKKYSFGKKKKDTVPYRVYGEHCEKQINLFFTGMYFELVYFMAVIFPCFLVLIKVGLELKIIIPYYLIADFTFNAIGLTEIKKFKKHFKNVIEKSRNISVNIPN